MIVSPFEQGAPAGKVAQAQEEAPLLEMNVANVDKVLDEVRPYLIADGGNVEVVGVDAASGTVDLRLQGTLLASDCTVEHAGSRTQANRRPVETTQGGVQGAAER